MSTHFMRGMAGDEGFMKLFGGSSSLIISYCPLDALSPSLLLDTYPVSCGVRGPSFLFLAVFVPFL